MIQFSSLSTKSRPITRTMTPDRVSGVAGHGGRAATLNFNCRLTSRPEHSLLSNIVLTMWYDHGEQIISTLSHHRYRCSVL